jgi:hypothetical protein
MCESIFEFIGPQYSTNGITGKLDWGCFTESWVKT